MCHIRFINRFKIKKIVPINIDMAIMLIKIILNEILFLDFQIKITRFISNPKFLFIYYVMQVIFITRILEAIVFMFQK